MTVDGSGCPRGCWTVLDEAEARGAIDWRVSVDSTMNLAHRHAAGAVVDEATMTEFVEVIDQRKARQKGGSGKG